jgi:hypothetical protein
MLCNSGGRIINVVVVCFTQFCEVGNQNSVLWSSGWVGE